MCGERDRERERDREIDREREREGEGEMDTFKGACMEDVRIAWHMTLPFLENQEIWS